MNSDYKNRPQAWQLGYDRGYVEYCVYPTDLGKNQHNQKLFWEGYTCGYYDAFGVYPCTPFSPLRQK